MNIPKLTDAQTEARACYVIYRLIDPVFNQIRYVRLTSWPYSRLQWHCNHPTNKAMAAWIQGLKQLGLMPTIEPIEYGLTEYKAKHREKYWIETYKSQGSSLLNMR